MTAAPWGKTAAVFAAAAFVFSAAPAKAADDGQASLLSGLATTFGLAKQDDPDIDFRERSKIVVPRKMVLPPPGSGASANAAWPTDVEIARDRRLKKIENAEPSALQRSSRTWTLISPGDEVKVTTSGFNRHGPSCRVPDPKTGECPEGPHQSLDWNPLTWVGLEKKPQAVLGPEPERENLIDPPKGYRAPAEGVGAKVDK